MFIWGLEKQCLMSIWGLKRHCPLENWNGQFPFPIWDLEVHCLCRFESGMGHCPMSIWELERTMSIVHFRAVRMFIWGREGTFSDVLLSVGRDIWELEGTLSLSIWELEGTFHYNFLPSSPHETEDYALMFHYQLLLETYMHTAQNTVIYMNILYQSK